MSNFVTQPVGFNDFKFMQPGWSRLGPRQLIGRRQEAGGRVPTATATFPREPRYFYKSPNESCKRAGTV